MKYLILILIIGCSEYYTQPCESFNQKDLIYNWYTADSIKVWFGLDVWGNLWCETYKGVGKVYQLKGQWNNNTFYGEGFILKFHTKLILDFIINKQFYKLSR
jgi:hypothetical protein